MLKIWSKQIDDLESAKRAGDLFGYPLMIKSKRLAYDGRGNAVAKSEVELSSAVTGNIFIGCQLNEVQLSVVSVCLFVCLFFSKNCEDYCSRIS